MLTLDQIKAAHAKVKSGAEFPAYLKELIGLGVLSYETYVSDGSTTYIATDGVQLTSEAKYPQIPIADQSDASQFARFLKSHQQGDTDYPTFCMHAAQTGVEKWIVDARQMTCSYYNKSRDLMLSEAIPS